MLTRKMARKINSKIVITNINRTHYAILNNICFFIFFDTIILHATSKLTY